MRASQMYHFRVLAIKLIHFSLSRLSRKGVSATLKSVRDTLSTTRAGCGRLFPDECLSSFPQQPVTCEVSFFQSFRLRLLQLSLRDEMTGVVESDRIMRGQGHSPARNIRSAIKSALQNLRGCLIYHAKADSSICPLQKQTVTFVFLCSTLQKQTTVSTCLPSGHIVMLVLKVKQ